MTEQEKSLELARLMGWECTNTLRFLRGNPIPGGDSFQQLNPYGFDVEGLAQFAAILLANIKVLDDSGLGWLITDGGGPQANILDEILRMKGEWNE